MIRAYNPLRLLGLTQALGVVPGMERIRYIASTHPLHSLWDGLDGQSFRRRQQRLPKRQQDQVGWVVFLINLGGLVIYLLWIRCINQSINQKITTYKSYQWCTTHLKTKLKPRDKVQKVKTTQR